MISKFTLSSPDFEDQNNIPEVFTCDGQNVPPRLNISGVPKNTVSLALVVDDPDSPSGSFTHWILFNLPPETTQIPTVTVTTKVGTNSFGSLGYGGPCPHQGEHRYVFSLYALDTMLKLDKPDISNLRQSISNHIIETTQLTGKYQRKGAK